MTTADKQESTNQRLYAVKEADKLNNQITEQYLDDRMLRQQKIRPIAVAAAVAFSLAYYDKWVVEIERKFPDLGK